MARVTFPKAPHMPDAERDETKSYGLAIINIPDPPFPNYKGGPLFGGRTIKTPLLAITLAEVKTDYL